MPTEKVKPLHELRLGRIKSTIWPARGPNPRLLSTKIVCLYKEKDGQTWKETTNFDRDDLPLVAKVADLSHTWIFTYCQDQNGAQHHEPAAATNEEF